MFDQPLLGSSVYSRDASSVTNATDFWKPALSIKQGNRTIHPTTSPSNESHPSTIPTTQISSQQSPLTEDPTPSLNTCQPVQNSDLTYAFNLRKPTPSTIPRNSTLPPTTGRPTPSLNTCSPVQFHPNITNKYPTNHKIPTPSNLPPT